MAEKKKFQAIKGTRDLLPPETELWNRVEQTAREVFGTFGFGEIRPPIFEPTELFARAVGGDTDIVGKEMYSFVDRYERLKEPAKIGDYGTFIEEVRKFFENDAIPQTLSNKLAISHMEGHWEAVQNGIRGEGE